MTTLPSADLIRVEFKSLGDHKFGCLMALLPDHVSSWITEWTKKVIPDRHLGPGGREDNPHITIKYGFRDSGEETVDALKELLKRYGQIPVRLNGFGAFRSGYGKWKNEDGDVLYVKVESPLLRELNKIISKTFPCKDSHPEYIPHATVAYIDPKHIGTYTRLKAPFLNRVMSVSEVEWSSADKDVEIIKLPILTHPQSGVKIKAMEEPPKPPAPKPPEPAPAPQQQQKPPPPDPKEAPKAPKLAGRSLERGNTAPKAPKVAARPAKEAQEPPQKPVAGTETPKPVPEPSEAPKAPESQPEARPETPPPVTEQPSPQASAQSGESQQEIAEQNRRQQEMIRRTESQRVQQEESERASYGEEAAFRAETAAGQTSPEKMAEREVRKAESQAGRRPSETPEQQQARLRAEQQQIEDQRVSQTEQKRAEFRERMEVLQKAKPPQDAAAEIGVKPTDRKATKEDVQRVREAVAGLAGKKGVKRPSAGEEMEARATHQEATARAENPNPGAIAGELEQRTRKWVADETVRRENEADKDVQRRLELWQDGEIRKQLRSNKQEGAFNNEVQHFLRQWVDDKTQQNRPPSKDETMAKEADIITRLARDRGLLPSSAARRSAEEKIRGETKTDLMPSKEEIATARAQLEKESVRGYQERVIKDAHQQTAEFRQRQELAQKFEDFQNRVEDFPPLRNWLARQDLSALAPPVLSQNIDTINQLVDAAERYPYLLSVFDSDAKPQDIPAVLQKHQEQADRQKVSAVPDASKFLDGVFRVRDAAGFAQPQILTLKVADKQMAYPPGEGERLFYKSGDHILAKGTVSGLQRVEDGWTYNVTIEPTRAGQSMLSYPELREPPKLSTPEETEAFQKGRVDWRYEPPPGLVGVSWKDAIARSRQINDESDKITDELSGVEQQLASLPRDERGKYFDNLKAKQLQGRIDFLNAASDENSILYAENDNYVAYISNLEQMDPLARKAFEEGRRWGRLLHNPTSDLFDPDSINAYQTGYRGGDERLDAVQGRLNDIFDMEIPKDAEAVIKTLEAMKSTQHLGANAQDIASLETYLQILFDQQAIQQNPEANRHYRQGQRADLQFRPPEEMMWDAYGGKDAVREVWVEKYEGFAYNPTNKIFENHVTGSTIGEDMSLTAFMGPIHDAWQDHLRFGGAANKEQFDRVVSEVVKESFAPYEHPYDSYVRLLKEQGWNQFEIDAAVNNSPDLEDMKNDAEEMKALPAADLSKAVPALLAVMESLRAGDGELLDKVSEAVLGRTGKLLRDAFGYDDGRGMPVVSAAHEVMRRIKLWEELPDKLKDTAQLTPITGFLTDYINEQIETDEEFATQVQEWINTSGGKELADEAANLAVVYRTLEQEAKKRELMRDALPQRGGEPSEGESTDAGIARSGWSLADADSGGVDLAGLSNDGPIDLSAPPDPDDLDFGDVSPMMSSREASPLTATLADNASLSADAHDVFNPPRQDTPEVAALRESVTQKLLTPMREATNLTPKQKQSYGVAMQRALRDLPEKVLSTVHRNLKSVEWAASPDEATRRFNEVTNKGVLPNKQQWLPPGQKVFGFLDRADSLLVLDGGDESVPDKWKVNRIEDAPPSDIKSQIYSHELGHVIDKDFKHSKSTDWYLAWQAEIQTREYDTPPLTKYAGRDQNEGFAEFCRLLYGSDVDKAVAELRFPKCFAFFRKQGLWGDASPIVESGDAAAGSPQASYDDLSDVSPMIVENIGGELPEDVQIITNTEDVLSAKFAHGDEDYEFIAGNENGDWQIMFGQDEGGALLNLRQGGGDMKKAVGVLSKVASLVGQLVREKSPKIFSYYANKTEPARVRLYDRASKRIADDLGYLLRRDDDGKNVNYRFYKMGPVKKATRWVGEKLEQLGLDFGEKSFHDRRRLWMSKSLSSTTSSTSAAPRRTASRMTAGPTPHKLPSRSKTLRTYLPSPTRPAALS